MNDSPCNRAPELFDLGDIRLRRPKPEDAEAIFEYGSDPEVARYADWPVQTSIEPIVELIEERKARWESYSEYYWVITESVSDRAIGGVSCRLEGDEAEIGYLLNRKRWGEGYATKAAGAVLTWLKSGQAVKKVRATCDTENLASVRVLEKLGMHRERVLERHSVRPALGVEPRDAYLYTIKFRITPA